MIIQEFSFGNFKSFKEIQTLNLSSAKIKSHKKILDQQNVIKGKNNDEVSFLKSKAIYGANASGKSNVIKAFVCFNRIIQNSVKDEKILKFIEPFKLSTETENSPTFFQIVFWHKDIKYRYGFEADDQNIFAEWLYGKPKERELPFFIRENHKIIELDKTNFLEGNKLMSLFEDEPSDSDIFRNNSLFLSTLASFGFGKISKSLIDALSSIFLISGLGHHGMYNYAGEAISDDDKKKYIMNFLKYGDTGIEDIDAVEISNKDLPEDLDEDTKKKILQRRRKKIIVSSRKKYDENLEFKENEIFSFEFQESEGTQKLFELSPFIYEALKNKRPILIDEFDARFHPLLTKKILELFNSNENLSSQLIFTTHDTNLLNSELLRKDQIEFVEKDKYGASHLYSLVEFKGVRNTASFEKDYIQGKYGAIPFLGGFNKILKSKVDA